MFLLFLCRRYHVVLTQRLQADVSLRVAFGQLGSQYVHLDSYHVFVVHTVARIDAVFALLSPPSLQIRWCVGLEALCHVAVKLH